MSVRNEKYAQDIGDYYAWGETAPKEVYDWSTYFDTEDDGDTFQKYNLDEGGKTVLDPEDDAASVALGGDWRMPSRAEQDELRSNCYWVWTSNYGGKSVNGYNGYIVYRAKADADKGVMVYSDGAPSSAYSVETDVHVFLPAAGYHNGSDLRYAGGYGYYWSRSLYEGNAGSAYDVGFGSDYVDWSRDGRYYGQSVRPVFSQTLIVWKNGEVLFSAETSAVDSISFHDYGTASIPLTDLGKTFVAVDLGLPSGTKWATFNLGATAPEEYGGYYAWGETAPKEVYNWSTYFDTEDRGSTFQKYNLDEGGKTVLAPEDDAASVALGGEWRMPTHAEQDELRSNCYWVWTSTYGVKSVNGYIVYKAKAEADKGVKVTSDGTPSSDYSVETDVHVFLPAAGYGGSDLASAGNGGLYWSRSLYEGSAYGAYGLNFGSGSVVWSSSIRGCGLSVRPVLPATE